MKMINRSAIVLLARAPFADWVASLADKPPGEDPHYQALTLEQLRETGAVYLIDEVEDEADFDQWLENHWQRIWQNELSAWDEFADCWPVLEQSEFAKWFEWRPQLATFDLSQQSLMTADLEA